jgi:hypothetical protein
MNQVSGPTQALPKADAEANHRKALEVMYGQVAAQHDKIDDFRAKLLALVPAATGIGLFTLLQKSERAPETVGQFRLRQRMERADHRWRAWQDTRR